MEEDSFSPPECHFLFGSTGVHIPTRYFVNLTSHLEFYQRRGVETTLVVVVRDPAMHFRGISSKSAYAEFQTGRTLLQQATEQINHVVVVSYETLMTLKDIYWQEVILPHMNLTTTTTTTTRSSTPLKLENDNIQWVPSNIIPKMVADKLRQDVKSSSGKNQTREFPSNLYEPKSWKELQAARKQNNDRRQRRRRR